MVRLIKESFNSDRYEEAQNYIDNGITTWREIFQDCSEIARTDKELKQSMIDQCGSVSKYAEEIFDAVQYILDNETNESVKHGSRRRSKRMIESTEYTDIYRDVARIVQDMDWRDYLDYDYDTPEEDWDAFVQSCAEVMDDDPFSVIRWLSDLTENYPEVNEVIDQIARFYASDFGIYARDFNTAIPIILKFNSVEDAEHAWEELPNIHDDETYGDSDLTGAADYTQTVLDDYNCTGYIEINRREIDKNMIGNALYYDNQIYYIVNGDSWFDVL